MGRRENACLTSRASITPFMVPGIETSISTSSGERACRLRKRLSRIGRHMRDVAELVQHGLHRERHLDFVIHHQNLDSGPILSAGG